VLEVATQLGHKPGTCLDIHGRLFEEFDPARRRPAVEVIEEARRAVRDGLYPLSTRATSAATVRRTPVRPEGL
jgi:hypothetical protein